jgi:hypothetical protein
MEYFCHYCREWYDTVYCQGHFESVHGQKNVTFDKLRERLACLGGLTTRDEEPTVTPPEAPNARGRDAWLLRDKADSKVFVTNNFHHNLE